MADMELNVTGLTEAVAWLDALPKNIVTLGFLRALDAAGDVIQTELASQTPVRTETRSVSSAARTGRVAGEAFVTGGAMRAAIRRTITIDSQYRGGTCVIDHGKFSWIANILEYGRRIVGHKPGLKDTGKTVRPNPFMRRTAEYAAQPAIDAFAASIADTVATFSDQKVS
jgi:hypothetical protein